MAWDRYAIAAAVLGQMPYDVAMLHKDHVYETAVNAFGEDRLPLLGVLFDEVSRYGVSPYHVAWGLLVAGSGSVG